MKDTQTASASYVLELKNITKIFPGVKALDQVHFGLKAGEIHALMGENGAGKSTFIKVITGVHHADEGDLYLEGKKVKFKGPKEAQAAGIAAIYQHVTAYPHLSVTENIFMGHELVAKGKLNWKQMHLKTQELLDELQADFKALDEMGSLSVAQQQLVEIAKALSMNARIIIMDEPTAALTKRESEELYKITEKLRDKGTGIIFISHRFEDMYRLASKVTVFRDAKYIGTYDVKEISNEDLIKAMVGREIKDLFPKEKITLGAEVFRIDKLSQMGFFKDISLSVKKGEIVGLTGLVGAGRTELSQCICGINKPTGGGIFVNQTKVSISNPQQAMDLGIGYLPEDRQLQGLILNWSISHNISLAALKQVSTLGFLRRKKENAWTRELAERVETKANSVFDLVSTLSGGNQQKVVVAKLLTKNLKVLILDEPTKGVDVGAKATIYKLMGMLAKKGYGIIMISSEMPEILGMCDRIYVMCEGRLTGELQRDEATGEKILEKAMLRE